MNENNLLKAIGFMWKRPDELSKSFDEREGRCVEQTQLRLINEMNLANNKS